MGGTVDFQPAFSRAFVGADLPPYVRGEDFRSASGHRVESGGTQTLQAVLQVQLVVPAHIVDFHGRVGLDGDRPAGRFFLPGEFLHLSDNPFVVAERAPGVHAAHDVDLGHAGFELCFAVGQDVFRFHAPGTGLCGVIPPVGTEAAAVGADVGRLDMEVAVVPDPVAVQAFAHKRRRRLQFGQGRLIKFQQFLPMESYQRSSELTVSFLRPWRRRAARTRRPLGVDILSRKPCLLRRLRWEG